MWKQQIALRNVLGDPWPSMSVEHGSFRNDVDDRVALITMMNEVNRLGRDPQRTNQQHRDVTEQTIRSAAVSSDMLARVIQTADADRERRKREGKSSTSPSPKHTPTTSPSATAAASHKQSAWRWGAEWPGSSSKASSAPNGGEGGAGQVQYMMHLTATERKLIERYRQQHAQQVEHAMQQQQQHGGAHHKAADGLAGGGSTQSYEVPYHFQMRSRSLPKERPRGRYLQPVAEGAEEYLSDGDDVPLLLRGVHRQAGKTVLQGGSFIETLDSNALDGARGHQGHKGERRSKAEASEGDKRSVKVFAKLEKSFTRAASGGKKTTLANIPAMFAEADQTLTDSVPVHRGPIGVTHASLFGQIRHFRNPESEVRETEIRREPQWEGAHSSEYVTPNLPV